MNQEVEHEEQKHDGKDGERKEILLFALQPEDSLVNNRLVWVLTIQGFLFAAVALAIEKGIEHGWFLYIISIMGIIIAVISTVLSFRANIHINTLKDQWGDLTQIVQDVSPFGSGQHKRSSPYNLVGLSFWLPLFTGVAWVFVLLGVKGILTLWASQPATS